jgi:uncharacterized membrane protein YphA (DoxX/SURF4 family)
MRRRLLTLPLVLLALASSAGVASAHVRYVTPGGDPVAVAEFLVGALSEPFNLAVLGVGAGAVVVAGVAYRRVLPFQADARAVREAMAGYVDLLPWLLRLSVGLPLVGAGFSGYLFSPAVTPDLPTFVRLFGITTGFLLLFGLATRFVATYALGAYLAGLAVDPTLLLAFEYVPALAAILLLGGGRPSADQVLAALASDDRTLYSRVDPVYRRLAIPVGRRLRAFDGYVPVVVRVGVGLAFVYLGVSQKLMNPGDALAVVEKYALTTVVPVSPELWVVGAGLAEVLVGVVLIVGAFTRAASFVAIGLFTLTLFGLPDDPVLAHVSLFGLASALVVTGAGPLSVDALVRPSRSGTGADGADDADADPGATGAGDLDV